MSSSSKKIGLGICVTGAVACLSFGMLGVVMCCYWHHVTGDWLDDHIFWWQERGMPATIFTFGFTRAMDLFK